MERRALPESAGLCRQDRGRGIGERGAVPAADLSARHGRRRLRLDEGCLGAHSGARPVVGRLKGLLHGVKSID